MRGRPVTSKAVRFRRSRLAIFVVLLAWLLLAMHLCWNYTIHPIRRRR